jgi:hypothetical protein
VNSFTTFCLRAEGFCPLDLPHHFQGKLMSSYFLHTYPSCEVDSVFAFFVFWRALVSLLLAALLCCPWRWQMKQLIDRHAGLLWNYFKKFPLQRHWNRTIPITPVKRTGIARRYPTPVQFAIASPIFWRGQDTHPNDIRWHWDQLYTKDRAWARDQEMDYGVVHSAAALAGPLELLSIVPAKDKGRLQNRRLSTHGILRLPHAPHSSGASIPYQHGR